MSDTVISAENVSKAYRLGQIGGGTIKEDFARWWAKMRRKPDPFLKIGEEHNSRRMGEQFLAVDNISFQLKQGEVLGIIGRNGAGKSTLLKILSQVTMPTSGQIKIKGRIASLLEVGTGFHPELTGRENIFLNGAILGMTKAEIRKKFDAIVAFSEISDFLDTPVKRYSSGMYVRLAFAVAAHLEPEILIVDEVLAVGDAEFQKKCLGKMESVSGKEGRTILFVSHQIAAVTRLCKKALWLDGGRVKDYGRADLICSEYLANGSSISSKRVWTDEQAPGNQWVRLESIEALAGGEPADTMDVQSPVDIRISYRVLKNGKVLIPNLHFFREDGTLIFISHDWYSGWRTKPKHPGRYQTTFTVPGNFFSEGRVTVKVAMGTYQPYEAHFEEPEVIAFTVVESTKDGTSRGDYAGHLPGIIRPLINSRTELINQQ
jgi:lipopolysaccharide transport system ATP-binding protein